MITDTAKPRRIEYRRGNDLAHKRQDRQICIEGNKLLGDLWGFECFVLMHRNTQLKSPLLDRIDFSARRIGKTEDRQHLFPFTDEFIQSLFCERCLSDKNNAHGVSPLLFSRRLADNVVVAAEIAAAECDVSRCAHFDPFERFAFNFFFNFRGRAGGKNM
jgi:hypothetical protein